MYIQKKSHFPGCLGAKTSLSQCKGSGSGKWILHPATKSSHTMTKDHVCHSYDLAQKNTNKYFLKNKMNEQRVYYTGWINSERERQISYINSYIWNLERWVSGQQWRCRHGKQTCGHSGKERVGWTERSIETYALPYVKLDSQWAFAVRLRELKSGARWQPRAVGWGERWEGDSRVKRHTYSYRWFMLIHGREQYCIVKQLSSN